MRELEASLPNHAKTSKAGAKPYDVVMMFKIILIKRFYNLSDAQAEYQIIDRLIFRDFWAYQAETRYLTRVQYIVFGEKKEDTVMMERLFKQFRNDLNKTGYFVNEGTIIDARFVEVLRQCNTCEENDKIKKGNGGELWKNKPHKFTYV
jgi:hypothetical protein